jgi:1-acyl-sn-glycerol-3-phosphate acyltransferase
LPVLDVLRQVVWTACFYVFLLCFAIGIYTVNIICLACLSVFSQEKARPIARTIVFLLFRLYVALMLQSGALRTNCDLLKRLRAGQGGRLIIANHPSMIDAPLFLSRIPNLVCVFKSSLKKSFTMARTASTLGYLSNDEGIALLKDLAGQLQAGEQVLLFPEGTRTAEEWLNPLNPGYALAAIRAQVPVQLVRIRADRPVLTKRQPFYKPARFPAGFQFDIGPCIEPGTFRTVRELNAFVEDWYRANLPGPAHLKRPFLPLEHTLATTSENGLRTTFKVPEDPFYCHGHMPSNPIVPAYAQMAWVREIVATESGSSGPPGFFRWKFLQPLLPGDQVEILVGPPVNRRDVVILRAGERVTQGKLLTSEPGEVL